MEHNNILIILTNSPEQSIKPLSAVRFAERGCRSGKKVTLACIAEGVLSAKKPEDKETLPGLASRMRQIIEMGSSVLACRAPAEFLGVKAEDLIDGVQFTDDVFGMIVRKDVFVIWL